MIQRFRDPEQFGPLLFPIVLEKLPNVIRLQISRELGNENWNIDEFIKCINKEIAAREHFQYFEDQDDKEKGYTASTVAVSKSNNSKLCVFCEKRYSDQGNMVTDLDARRDREKEENMLPVFTR